MTKSRRVFVTGGAGYVGAVLVSKLLAAGHRVRVLDWYLYGDNVLAEHAGNPLLEEHRGDLRDDDLVRELVRDCDAVVHLACISNDPSFELEPELGRTINLDAFEPLVRASRDAGVQRFIYASSSSVYGLSDEPNVDETHPLKPLTDYSRFKMECERQLREYQADDFTTITLRPATVCGYSPRLRLDLTVNILTNHAVNNGKITVFGGTQKRPNIHIDDVTDLYVQLLDEPAERVAGKVFNAGYENHTVAELATFVRDVVRAHVPGREELEIVTTPTDDLRSYHISSDKIATELGYRPRRTIENAVRDLVRAFASGWVPDSMTDPKYFNVEMMKQHPIPTLMKSS